MAIYFQLTSIDYISLCLNGCRGGGGISKRQTGSFHCREGPFKRNKDGSFGSREGPFKGTKTVLMAVERAAEKNQMNRPHTLKILSSTILYL